MVKQIDSIRGEIPRSRWIKKALESLSEVTMTALMESPLKTVQVGRLQSPAGIKSTQSPKEGADTVIA